MQNYQVGQILFLITDSTKVIPIQVFEEVTRTTLSGKEKTYITSVGLYDDSNELLAVAKLSQPILKSKSREALIKVKLDF